jgi:tRNA nucleotidyltransferase (CCA-adding enzyme)
MVVDEAAAQRGDRAGTEHGRWLLLGALCHDLGKPSTTSIDGDGRVRSPSHDVRGEEITVEFLSRLRASDRTVRAVAALVRWHLAPLLLSKQGAGDRAYRKLARRLDAAGIDGALLVDLARADHWGRTTPEALARDFSDAEAFVERLRALDLMESAPVDRVRGRDVLARGIAPGPEVGRIVTRCREIQDESGWTDPDQILDRALAES